MTDVITVTVVDEEDVVPGTGAAIGGARWYSDAGVPSPAVGNPGDFYLDSTTGLYYEKVGDAWVNRGDLRSGDVSGPASSTSGQLAVFSGSSGKLLADSGIPAGNVSQVGHTHVIANVTGLQAALDGKAEVSHTHVIANVTGLQTALDGKAALSHTHVAADVTGLGALALLNQAGTPQIADNAVTTAKIAPGAVITDDLADGAATTAKIADGAATLAKLDRTGATGRVLTAQGSGNAPVWAVPTSAGITLGTPVNSTSGTFIDFTGIPAGVNRVTVNLVGVSTNGTAEAMIQLGDSGGVETTGYATGYGFLAGSSGFVAYTDSFNVGGALATDTRSGTFVFSRVTGNVWNGVGIIALPAAISFASGTKTLSDTLDRVRITTRGGTNTFDAGQINVSWEF